MLLHGCVLHGCGQKVRWCRRSASLLFSHCINFIRSAYDSLHFGLVCWRYVGLCASTKSKPEMKMHPTRENARRMNTAEWKRQNREWQQQWNWGYTKNTLMQKSLETKLNGGVKWWLLKLAHNKMQTRDPLRSERRNIYCIAIFVFDLVKLHLLTTDFSGYLCIFSEIFSMSFTWNERNASKTTDTNEMETVGKGEKEPVDLSEAIAST